MIIEYTHNPSKTWLTYTRSGAILCTNWTSTSTALLRYNTFLWKDVTVPCHPVTLGRSAAPPVFSSFRLIQSHQIRFNAWNHEQQIIVYSVSKKNLPHSYSPRISKKWINGKHEDAHRLTQCNEDWKRPLDICHGREKRPLPFYAFLSTGNRNLPPSSGDTQQQAKAATAKIPKRTQTWVFLVSNPFQSQIRHANTLKSVDGCHTQSGGTHVVISSSLNLAVLNIAIVNNLAWKQIVILSAH